MSETRRHSLLVHVSLAQPIRLRRVPLPNNSIQPPHLPRHATAILLILLVPPMLSTPSAEDAVRIDPRPRAPHRQRACKRKAQLLPSPLDGSEDFASHFPACLQQAAKRHAGREEVDVSGAVMINRDPVGVEGADGEVVNVLVQLEREGA